MANGLCFIILLMLARSIIHEAETERVRTGARPVLTCCQVIEVGVCNTSCLCMKLLKCNDSAS